MRTQDSLQGLPGTPGTPGRPGPPGWRGLLVAGLLCGVLAGAPGSILAVNVDEILANAPGERDYPDADAVVLYENITYEISEDGLVTRRFHRFLKLFTEWACRNLSDERPSWNASRQELSVQVCRTYMRDGRTVDTGPQGFNEVTPDGVSRCADFLSLREMVISHVGVERGAIVELDYEIRDLAAGPLPPGGLEFLQGRHPVLLRQVRVRAPADRLRHALLNGEGLEVSPAFEKSGGLDLVTWRVHNLPGLPPEGNEANTGDYLPYVVFSTCGDWTRLASQLHGWHAAATPLAPELRQWLVQQGPEFEDAVPDLTVAQSIGRIAGLIGHRIRTARVRQNWSLAPRPPAAVFASSYGTPWEKALLALHLLRGLGLEPEIAFFSRWRSLAGGVPTPLNFHELRVVVPADGQQYWLAPDAGEPGVGKCDLTGRTGLFLEDTPKGYRKYTVPEPASRCVLAVDVRTADGGGFRAEIDYLATERFRRADGGRSVDEIAAALAGAVLPEGEVAGTNLEKLTPYEIHLRITATSDSLGTTLAGVLMVDLPSPPHDLLRLLPASFRPSASSRETPLFCGGELQEELRYRLTLPEKLVPDDENQDQHVTCDAGEFVLAAGFSNNRLTLNRRFSVTGAVVGLTDYATFHHLVSVASRQSEILSFLIQQ